jgi:hypothetical protein
VQRPQQAQQQQQDKTSVMVKALELRAGDGHADEVLMGEEDEAGLRGEAAR